MIIGIDGNEANVKNRVGANQYAFELLLALYDLPESQEHQFIIYLRSNPLPDMPKRREGWEYKVFGPKYFWTQLALPFSLFFGKHLDIFFTPGHYRPRWSPIPTVVSIMDLGYLRYPEQFTKRDWLQLSRWTGHSIKNANHILAISESTKKDIVKSYGVPDKKITVTYPGYDRKNFQFPISNFQLKQVKEKYKIDGDYILFLGTLKPSKNVEGLIQAFRLLGSLASRNNKPKSPMTQEPNDLSLVIAGKRGWLYDSIFSLVKELGLEEKVIFTDFVADEDVPSLLSGAKVFVLPSFWEGFGIPAVEAMAVGTPVVASNVGSLPEVVGNADILVDPNMPEDIAKGIEKALKNHKKLSKKGLVRVKMFDWQKTAHQTLGVLEKVVNPDV